MIHHDWMYKFPANRYGKSYAQTIMREMYLDAGKTVLVATRLGVYKYKRRKHLTLIVRLS